MKKLALLFLLFLFPFVINAQIKFGYLSYQTALNSMPENKEIKENLAFLREQYVEETVRAEQEFNQKYEDFLQGQATFAPGILYKRQAELQELLDRNISFKKEAERLYSEAEKEYYAPLKTKLDYILLELGNSKGYAFIINTDDNGLPFANPEYGEDITSTVCDMLNEGY